MSAPPIAVDPLTASTIGHYETHAERYWQGTREHDVGQNVAALLAALDGPGPWTILDFGCGPGRDLKTFRDLGHRAIGLDGSAAFCAMARAHGGCEVWRQDFLALALPPAHFDGVFANATLFHVPGAHLPRVLAELRATLKPGGALFCSNPHGSNQEGFHGERYVAYFEPARWQALLDSAGFTEVTHYFRPPGLTRAQQPWFAGVWRRTA
ncbi:MAG: methyltransferase domain-containing protein [Gammaproteobacteria bacterium]|nr:methyltransferase domain-containing protein [Gammaproteobacteria bacterium]